MTDIKKSHRNVEPEGFENNRRTKLNEQYIGTFNVKRPEHHNYKPKKNTMKKILSFAKRAGSLIVGVLTGGGSFLAGVDFGTSALIGACAIMVVLGVEMAVVKEFKTLFEKDDENNK